MSLLAWALLFSLLVVLRIALRDRTLDMTWLLVLWAPFNRLTFELRRGVHRRPREVVLANEPKTDLFAYAPVELRAALRLEEARLRTTYSLEELGARSTVWNYRENLYVLGLLESAFADVPRQSRVRALDVGSAIFCYATALERFARMRLSSGEASVLGIEVDGNVLYRDGTTRADHARAHARLAGPNVAFEVADFLTYERGTFELVTLFYPFVTKGALLRWGLPRGMFQRDAFLSHAVSAVAPGGYLLVVNHTHEERDIVRAWMAAKPSLTLASAAAVESQIVDYAADVGERSYSLYRRSSGVG